MEVKKNMTGARNRQQIDGLDGIHPVVHYYRIALW